jgi:ferredoxin
MKIVKKYRVSKGCTYCGTCIYECPVDAIELTDAGAVIDEGTCIGCGACYDNCASEAIEAYEIEQADDGQ